MLATLRKGRFFIVCVWVLWYIGFKEGGEEIENSVYQPSLPRPCDCLPRSGALRTVLLCGKASGEKHGKKCVRIFTSPATNKELMRQFISAGGPMGILRFPLIGTLWTQDCVKGLGIRLKCRNWLDEIVENPPDCNLVYTLRSFQPFAEDFSEEQFHFVGPSVYDRKA